MNKLLLTIGSLFSLSAIASLFTNLNNSEINTQITPKVIAIQNQVVQSDSAKDLSMDIKVDLYAAGIKTVEDLSKYSKMEVSGYKVTFLDQETFYDGKDWNLDGGIRWDFSARHNVGRVWTGDISGFAAVVNVPIDGSFFILIHYSFSCWSVNWTGLVSYARAWATSGSTVTLS